jgi:hypothetical protein
MNALGFLFLGLVLSSLAESNGNTAVPVTDEDALLRLLGDIFESSFEIMSKMKMFATMSWNGWMKSKQRDGRYWKR